MPTYPFETVDVFTTQRFGGNPLAVFPEASGLTDGQMQHLAAEFNLSETTFVLPPAQTAHTARVRIFNRSHEMPFAGDVRTTAHPPTLATVGNTYVITELEPARLDAATPDLAHFRRVLGATPGLNGRFSMYLYARTGQGTLAARMFAPIVGTFEDPATGSAATPLAALLLSLTRDDQAAFAIHQGVKMGRPSLLRASAWRAPDGIRARVAGACVPVLTGTALV